MILIALIFVAREIYLIKCKQFPYWLFLILVLIFFPVTRIFDLGQVELFILLGLFISLRLFKKGHQKSAGIILGVISALKIYPLFFLIFFALKKRWQTIIFTLVTFIIIILLSFIILPNSQANYYVRDVFPKLITGEASSSTVNGQLSFAGTKYWPSNQSLTGFFYHNLTQQEVNQGFINNPQLAEILRLIFSGIIFLTTIVTIYYYRHQKIDNLLFSLLIVTFILINPLSWPHYLALSILPIFFILNSIIKLGLKKN